MIFLWSFVSVNYSPSCFWNPNEHILWKSDFGNTMLHLFDGSKFTEKKTFLLSNFNSINFINTVWLLIWRKYNEKIDMIEEDANSVLSFWTLDHLIQRWQVHFQSLSSWSFNPSSSLLLSFFSFDIWFLMNRIYTWYIDEFYAPSIVIFMHIPNLKWLTC